MNEALKYLDDREIPYEHYFHNPVATAKDLEKLPDMGAEITKNLFLKDKKGEHVLVTVGVHKRVDLKQLEQLLDRKKLTFASAEELAECLKVTPGAVTLLGFMSDTSHAVQYVIDKKLWEGEKLIQCHPLVNTESVTLSRAALEEFFASTGHTVQVLDIPERK